jgi:hypothetical protein
MLDRPGPIVIKSLIALVSSPPKPWLGSWVNKLCRNPASFAGSFSSTYWNVSVIVI